jgi:hypothetical protein
MNDREQMAEEQRDPRLLAIWYQREIPVVVRTHKCPRVLVTLSAIEDADSWLRGEHRGRPRWDTRFKCRSVPKSWFDDVIERALRRFGRVYVIQPYREQQRCAPACWNAQGHTCECSCLGANHGLGRPSALWREISETFAFQWGPRQYGCRLLQGSGRPTALSSMRPVGNRPAQTRHSAFPGARGLELLEKAAGRNATG